MLLSHGGSSRGISCLLFTRIVLVPNYRIIELFFFTRSIAEGHGVLSRDLSFGPTDQREVICELSIFSSHGESRRSRFYCPEFANCRIFHHTENHGESRGGVTNYRISFFTRRVTESHGESRDLCHELSNYRISFHTEDHGGFLCHKTCFWSRICELSNFFLHTDGCGGYEGGTIEA